MDSATPSRVDATARQPSLLRHRSFVLFWCARTSTSGAYQMQAVAVGWQLYDLTHDPLHLRSARHPSLLRHRSFVLFWCARTSTSGAYQMQAVAVGWQLYDLTHDPLDL